MNSTYYFLLLLATLMMACQSQKTYVDKAHTNWSQSSPPDTNEVLLKVHVTGDKDFALNNKSFRAQDGSANHVYIYTGNKDETPAIMSMSGALPDTLLWEDFQQISLKQSSPREVFLHPDVVAIMVNTPGWIASKFQDRPNSQVGKEYNDVDFFVELEDAIRRNKGKHIILCLPHPLMTNGKRGGHFSTKDHLFPLTELAGGLYLPMPIIGSFYPIFRQYGISRQDLNHPRYKRLQKTIFSLLEKEKQVTIVSGMEGHIQLSRINDFFQVVVSRSNEEEPEFAANRQSADFVGRERGIAQLSYFSNGEAWVNFFPLDENQIVQKKADFRIPLYAFPPTRNDNKKLDQYQSYRDSARTVVVGDQYKISGFGSLFLGKHHRDVWRSEITIPYLDMGAYNGGIIPIKKGGGKQTLSLRMRDSTGLQVNFRTVNKNPESVLPGPLQKTWAADVVQDQISASHPYGALAIPKLASAAGVYHTKPELFYFPYDERLGVYLNEVGGKVGLLEIRPDEDLSQFENFGYTQNAVGTETMYEALDKKAFNRVDQRMYLKARLFDMLIGDWDRHEDQWRWAEFKDEDGYEMFRPIPRDRDQVFPKYDGLFPWISSRKWATRRLQSYKPHVNDAEGYGQGSNNLDRNLLNGLTLSDWMEVADSLKAAITQDVVFAAINDLPKGLPEQSNGEIANNLLSRADQVPEYAKEYYEVLAESVEIIGTNDEDFFKIERLPGGETRVRMYSAEKKDDNDRVTYDRTFKVEETKEIRIYGREENDRYEVTGDVKKGSKLRLLGGEGDDKYEILSSVSGLSNKTVIYDVKSENNFFAESKDTNLKLYSELGKYEYDRRAFFFDYAGPQAYFGYNVEDGIFLGGGVKWINHGFRKEPYASSHLLLANVALSTGATNVKYEGHFPNKLGNKLDLRLIADFKGPQFVRNYFGQGNEIVKDSLPREYYRLKVISLNVSPLIEIPFTKYLKVGFGPIFNAYQVGDRSGTVTTNAEIVPQDQVDETYYFGGLQLQSKIRLYDHPTHPSKGVKWVTTFRAQAGLQNNEFDFSTLTSDATIYFTPKLPWRMTFALGFGGATHFGDFPFFEAVSIGQDNHLRGYLRNRFSGRSYLYQNAELRLELLKLRSHFVKGTFGISGFYDQGRVWADGEAESNTWHPAYGPGVYLQFYEFGLLSASYAISDEERLVQVKFGFFF